MKNRSSSTIRLRMRVLAFSGIVSAATLSVPARAQDAPPLLAERSVAAIAGELSGTIAKQTVQDLSRFHRMRGSRGFAHAVEAVRSRAETYGLSQVEVIELPADGEIFYGTQRSRPAWDADFAELWELQRSDAGWARRRRIASWEDQPVTLAQDSASGKVTADLIDVGDGTSEEDYEGKNVRGRLVLAGAQPVSVYRLAVDRHGAAGIVSYAQNQRTAWWGEDENLIRWGHLHTFPPPKTFAFMVSLKQAREWRRRLADGEIVRLEAEVRAGQHAGSYDIVTGVIPGHDPQVSDEQIVLSCHLDHQRPGANDNASGCATILEIARTLTKLIREGRLDPPRRTIRFIWPAEIEGTIALLNARPDLAAATRAVVHMDMVGGHAAITKAVFHVTRSPKSLPTFVNDVAEAFGRFVNEQSYRFAASGEAAYPLVDAGGGKEAALGRMADFSRGSDHEVWTEGSFRVPAIYLNDWPDRYIHTHADEIANIDATKLLRAAFIGGASAYYLAQLEAKDVPALWRIIEGHALERAAAALGRAQSLVDESRVEARNVLRFQRDYERGVLASIGAFAAIPPAIREDGGRFLDRLDRLMPGFEEGRRLEADQARLGRVIYHRSDKPKGTMSAFGYSYFEDKVDAAGLPRPLLLEFQGRWGGGSEYAYEALNFVDGKRSVLEVRDDVSAIYGPVPLETVAAYLDTLARIGVVRVGR